MRGIRFVSFMGKVGSRVNGERVDYIFIVMTREAIKK